jgi:hypothetical protein
MRTPAALLLLIPLLASGCSGHGNPAAPSRTAANSATAMAGTPAQQTSAPDLARCLQGGGNPDCLAAHAAPVVSPATAPSAPTNLSCSVSGSLVVFSWSAPTSGDPVSTYRMQAGTFSGSSGLADFNTNSTTASYTTFGVGAGSYYVRVLAVNASSQSSGASNEVLLVVGTGAGCTTTTTSTATVPSAPRSLVNASQSAGTISLTWLAPSTGIPTSYVLQAGSAPGRADLANADLGNTAVSYIATNVPAGSYYVRVYAKNSAGTSPASNEVLVFVVAFNSEVQVSVSWDAPSDVDLHVVEPSGTEIYYGNSSSSSGGTLDVDSNPACSIDGRQIENIRWSRTAPAGTYTVRVDYWSGCSVTQTNYTVTVKNGGSTQTFTGNFTGSGDHGGSGSGRLITTFVRAAASVLTGVGDTLEPFRAPAPFQPSAEKLRRTIQR